MSQPDHLKSLTFTKRKTKQIDLLEAVHLRQEVYTRKHSGDFPRGAAVKNPPANAGGRGSSPGPGRSHMPRSN